LRDYTTAMAYSFGFYVQDLKSLGIQRLDECY
jgi:hypothetical protein